MSASGLGGSINLISKSGFESRKPVFAYQISTQFHNKSGITFDGGRRNHISATSPKYTQPSFNLSYLRPVGKTLAFTFGLSRTWRLKQMFSGNDAAETANWDLINPVQRTSTWINNAQVLHTWSGQFGAEWRITPTDTVSTSFEYRATSNTTSGSGFLANYGSGATGGPTFSQGAATGVGVVTQGNRVNWERPNKNTHATAKYAHKGPVWRLDGSGSFSFADGRLFDIANGYFSTTPATISNLILRGEGIPAAGGILPRNYTATTRTGTAVDVYDGANYVLGSATSDQNVFYTTKTSAKLDLGRDFTSQSPFTVKVGLSNSQMQRDEKRFTRTWNFRPNGLNTDAARLAGNFDIFDAKFSQPLYSHPMRWISSPKVYDLYRQHPDWFVLDEAVAHQNIVSNSREFSEAISAAYLRTDVRLLKNRLWVVAGWRAEHTSVKGAGPLDDVGAQYQTTASGDFVRDAAGQKILITTNALERARLRYKERGAHSSNAYNTYHPSVNTTFSVAENLVVRAAYARTIGRPQVSLIAPGATISDPDVASPTITVSNTGLKPWTADNYDLSVESYFIKNGLGSIGVFQKNIRNFFGATRTATTPELLDRYGLPNDPDYLRYEVVTQSNVGDATIKGFEFSYRQALTFLPFWARGIQLSFNASRMTLDGSNSADFTGFSPSSYSGGRGGPTKLDSRDR
jgi:TonB-dependent receptor